MASRLQACVPRSIMRAPRPRDAFVLRHLISPRELFMMLANWLRALTCERRGHRDHPRLDAADRSRLIKLIGRTQTITPVDAW